MSIVKLIEEEYDEICYDIEKNGTTKNNARRLLILVTAMMTPNPSELSMEDREILVRLREKNQLMQIKMED